MTRHFGKKDKRLTSQRRSLVILNLLWIPDVSHSQETLDLYAHSLDRSSCFLDRSESRETGGAEQKVLHPHHHRPSSYPLHPLLVHLDVHPRDGSR